MEQKGFDKKLDEVAEKFSKAMNDGVKRMEEAFQKGKESFQQHHVATDRWKHHALSPTGGFIIVGVGIVWLLYTLGVFSHPVFPILVIVLGLFLIFRRRPE